MIDKELIHAGRACVREFDVGVSSCKNCRFRDDMLCMDKMISSLANELEKAVFLLQDDESDRMKKIKESGE